MKSLALAGGLVASLLLLPATDAARQPEHLAGRAYFETAPGVAAARVQRGLTRSTPAAHRSAAAPVLRGSWRIQWDGDTGAPVRIYGDAVPAPGSVRDPAAAADVARAFLAENIAVLAPGASASDFELVANVELRGLRTLTFQQKHRGLEVVGGYVGFRFKNDRLFMVASEALPNVVVDTMSTAAASSARRAAATWIDGDFGSRSAAAEVAAPVILPIISGAGQIAYHTAVPVEVESQRPFGLWTVYVGAGSRPVARKNNIHYASGSVVFDTPDRWPGDTRSDYPAALTNAVVDGAAQTSTAAGVFSFPGASAAVTLSLAGPTAIIQNGAPPDPDPAATASFTLDDGGSTRVSGNNELVDAQVTSFTHAVISKEYARSIGTLVDDFLDTQMPVVVNRDDGVCNAFATGDTINFFLEGTSGGLTCGNTALLVDVIHHEFGHNLHIQSLNVTGVPFDSAFSEGLSDYFAATITNDPQMGRGFIKTPDALRPMEGPEGEMNWPQGFSTVDTHITGVIFAAAMWDLRQALVAEMGEEAGVAYADQLFYGAVQRATDVFTTYAEILAEDDDDGNLANGTPNKCLIDYAFGSHGIGDEGTQLLGPGLEAPIDDRYNIIVPTRTPANGCAAPAVDGIDVTWRLRGDESAGETIAMELDGAEYRATIPTQPEINVIEYQVTVRYADGNIRRMPLNRGEPFYEIYIGDTQELYCTDFETDPSSEWTFGSNAGINDWEWGTPLGSAGERFNFDPPAAFSGNNVIGTGLSSPGGAYQTENASFAESPVIDVPNPGNIHVQYRRWLGVESSLVDRATISANNSEQYVNAVAPNALFAIFPQADHEWRFHDVDISDASAGGSVQVRFELADGGAGTHAGWNVDDFCVVKAIASTCGDSRVTGNESCDEGEANSDTEADACRATTCQPATCGDGVRDTAEECDDGNDVDEDDCSNACIDQSSGCGCQSSGGTSGGAVLVMLLFLGYLRRRRA